MVTKLKKFEMLFSSISIAFILQIFLGILLLLIFGKDSNLPSGYYSFILLIIFNFLLIYYKKPAKNKFFSIMTFLGFAIIMLPIFTLLLWTVASTIAIISGAKP